MALPATSLTPQISGCELDNQSRIITYVWNGKDGLGNQGAGQYNLPYYLLLPESRINIPIMTMSSTSTIQRVRVSPAAP